MTRPLPFLFLACLLLARPVSGRAAGAPDKSPKSDPSPEAEQASFVVHPDFETTLYADESLGIANPVAIHWDALGRLWVLCTAAYAQLKPGELPDDKLFILEDTDGDGRADRSTVFADGLNMPLGFALGHGGAWIAADAELLFLRDTDGDGRADERKVVLSGFGTGDTHQNISNLVFDAGGFLYFSQGLHTYSQVETPWGVARGDTAGFWRFDPRLTRLDPYGFPSMTSQNPCGVTLDRWGALFVKSNGPHLCFATPGLVPTTHPRELMQFALVGETPGKSMGVDIAASAHLPDWIQEHAIISGYFTREVSAIPLVEEGAGFANSPPVQLIFGGHESFRPVDIRQGPDGALYIADWFNPIINHYQVSLRHPDRDYDRGRIWKLSAKGRAPVEWQDLSPLGLEELVEQLRQSERWPREQARRLLSDHARPEAVVEKLRAWIARLSPDEAVALVDAAGVLESLGAVDAALLDRLEASAEPRVRAVAARILARSADPVPDAEARLARLVVDPHPRPRLEAVIALANRPEPSSLPLALKSLDAGADRFVEYSLSQAVFALEKQWLEPVQSGALAFERPSHLAFVLETYGGERSAQLARQALQGELTPEDRLRLLAVLARLGTAEDLDLVFAQARETRSASLLQLLAESAERRGVRPRKVTEAQLRELLQDEGGEMRALGLQLSGLWKQAGLSEELRAFALDAQAALSVRTAAISAYARVAKRDALVQDLEPLVRQADAPAELRRAAFAALASADLVHAARLVVDSLSERDGSGEPPLLPLLLSRPQGPATLAARFAETAPDTATAQLVLTAMNRLGKSDAELTPLLNRLVGLVDGSTGYDAAKVAAVVAAVREGKGSAERGAEVFQLAQLACVACHQIGDQGGVIGPALNGVGAGMPLDQIVESILWPERQIKEGYQAVAITTAKGATITGYIERESDEILWYRDAATPWIKPLTKKEITRREVIPTLMPPGLTASLSEQQFIDLVAYLASLKG